MITAKCTSASWSALLGSDKDCHTVGVSHALFSPVRAYIHVLCAGCYEEVRCERLSINYTAILTSTCPISHKEAGEIAFKARAYFKQEEGDGGPLYDLAKRVEWTANACAVKRNYHITSQEIWSFNCQAKSATEENRNRSGSMAKADVEAYSIAGHGGIFVHKKIQKRTAQFNSFDIIFRNCLDGHMFSHISIKCTHMHNHRFRQEKYDRFTHAQVRTCMHSENFPHLKAKCIDYEVSAHYAPKLFSQTRCAQK